MKSRSVILGTALAVAVLLTLLAMQRPFTIAGDPHAVYFPIVRGLFAKHGTFSFAHLADAGLRMPLYPVVLALAAWIMPTLVAAAQLVGIAAAVAVIAWSVSASVRRGAPLFAAGLAGLAQAAHPNFLRSSLEPLPDMLYLALFVAALALAIRCVEEVEAEGEAPLVWAGVLGGAGFLVRVNGIALVIGVLFYLLFFVRGTLQMRALRGLHYGKGVAIVLLPWLVIIAALQPDVIYPRLDLGASGSFGDAGQVSKLAGIAHAVWVGAKDQPARIVQVMPWWMAIAGIVALMVAARRSSAARLVAVVTLAMLGMLIPMHFEPRYYLFVPAVLFPASALGVTFLIRRFGAVKALAGFAVATILAAGFGVRNAWGELSSESGVGAELEQICAKALDLSRRTPDRPWVIGIESGHLYSNLRTCPYGQGRSTGKPPFLLVRSNSDWAGLDAFFTSGGHGPPFEMPVLGKVGGSTIYEYPPPKQVQLGQIGSTVIADLDFHLPYHQTCLERRLNFGAGTVARASVVVPDGMAMFIMLEQAEHRAPRWTSASGDIDLDVSMFSLPGEVTVKLCAGEPLSVGRGTLTHFTLGSAL
jgi:hypothetical protein